MSREAFEKWHTENYKSGCSYVQVGDGYMQAEVDDAWFIYKGGLERAIEICDKQINPPTGKNNWAAGVDQCLVEIAKETA
jgi:hypothetical protein